MKGWSHTSFLKPDPVKITLGFNAEDKRVYGMMLYHRNRLIMPYVRVGMQLSAGYKGVGVIGVIEADFLQVSTLLYCLVFITTTYIEPSLAHTQQNGLFRERSLQELPG